MIILFNIMFWVILLRVVKAYYRTLYDNRKRLKHFFGRLSYVTTTPQTVYIIVVSTELWKKNNECYLEVGHVSVTLLTACVVTQLHVPLTRQTMEKVRKLLQDGIEDVLKDTTQSVVEVGMSPIIINDTSCDIIMSL